MKKIVATKRLFSFLLSLLLIFSVIIIPVSAEEAEVTEDDIYVFDRDKTDGYAYFYRSPCTLEYTIDNGTGPVSTWTEVFVFNMYNTATGEAFPTYCTDITVTANLGADYRRLNLEDSSYSAASAGRVRAILNDGFYIVPISGETDTAHAERVNAKVAEIGKAAGIEDLTAGEAIAATQAAIWQVIHGPSLTFTNFCRNVWRPTLTRYSSLCSYTQLYSMDKTVIHSRIKTVFDYLLTLEPVDAADRVASSASFVDLEKPVLTLNADGTYDISVTTTVDVDMYDGDEIALKATLNESYFAKTVLSAGVQTITLTIPNVPASLASGDVVLSVSGYQTAEGYFLFDAIGNRNASQSMVGYNNSRLPVYASVLATEDRIISIYKSTTVEAENGSYVREPLSNIIFNVYSVATMEEYNSGAVVLPEASEYTLPSLPEYVLVTDGDGKASMNLVHYGLSDGVYLIVEQDHPSIVKPLDPFYIFVPGTDPNSSDPVYEIELEPKNELKSGVKIEKDVITVGNDSSTLNAYDAHTWIIGTTIPEDISNGKSYVITDTLDNRLDYLGNLTVKLERIDGTVEAVTLTLGTDYKLSVTDVDSLSDNNPSDSFKVELISSGMSKIATAIGENSFDDYILRTYFDAAINANADMGTQIPNQANLNYVNAADVEFDVKSDIPYVYTGGINLLKVDAKDAALTLQGAVFEIYRVATVSEVAAGGDNLTEIPGVVGKVVKVGFYGNSSLGGEKISSVTSDANGRVGIYGLAYGKYYLVEVEAPTGYNLLDSTIELTIDSSSHLEEKTVTIKNVGGIVLPETGGMGTTIYTVSGIILLCVACLLIYLKKRQLI